MGERHIIKMYDHMALLRLVMDDIRRVHGVKRIHGKFDYVSGLDTTGDVYIRVSLKPIRLRDERSDPGE